MKPDIANRERKSFFGRIKHARDGASVDRSPIRKGTSSSTTTIRSFESTARAIERSLRESGVERDLEDGLKREMVDVIDITDDSEHCASCPRKLPDGGSSSSSIFQLTGCHCVVCGQCASVAEVAPPLTDLVCSHHPAIGPQRFQRLYGTGCDICSYDDDDDQRKRKQRRRLACGHVFYQPCVNNWFRHSRTCPKCRISITEPDVPVTVQRSVVRRELLKPG